MQEVVLRRWFCLGRVRYGASGGWAGGGTDQYHGRGKLALWMHACVGGWPMARLADWV